MTQVPRSVRIQELLCRTVTGILLTVSAILPKLAVKRSLSDGQHARGLDLVAIGLGYCVFDGLLFSLFERKY